MFDGVDFYGNDANGYGGALYTSNANVRLTDVTVQGNTATSGAGIYVNGTGNTLTIEDSHFEDNVATGSGGAVYSRVDTTIDNSEFNDNEAFYGAAVYAFAASAHLEMTDSRVANNTHGSRVSGAVELPTSVDIDNVDFYNNDNDLYDYRATTGSTVVDGLGYGAIIQCDSTTCAGL